MLKEGLLQDFEHREELLELVQWKSTAVEGWTTLAGYKSRMQKDQKAIYYLTGGQEAALRNSPLLAAWKRKGIEVLIMDDEIDEIVAPGIGTYLETELKAVNRSATADDLATDEDKAKEKDSADVVEKIQKALGDAVKDVRASVRLADAPSCIVLDDQRPERADAADHEALGTKDLPEVKPILEVNPGHAIVVKLAGLADEAAVADASRLLLEQALLLEGAPLADPAGFVARLNRALEKSL